MLGGIDDFTPEALAILVERWLDAMDALDGYCESFNGKLRDEQFNREIFKGPAEARPVASAETR